jgi:hypothetical protein
VAISWYVLSIGKQKTTTSRPNQKAGSKQMNRELVIMVEPDAGRVTVEVSGVPKLALADLQKGFG